MKRLLLSLILLCSFGIAYADVVAELHDSKAQLGQTFILTLTMDGREANKAPDLTPLLKDFNLVGTERSMNYSLVNGQAYSSSQWNLSLTAKRAGVLIIPPLPIGQKKTAAVTITVSKQLAPTQQVNSLQDNSAKQQDVILTAEVNVEQPFVNQQIIYTVKLYNANRLLDASYQPPEVEDALMVPFNDSRRYQITNSGRVYAVEEQQFALFPQKSGDLTIKPPRFSALVYDVVAKRVNVEAQPLTLHVKPIPTPFDNKNWLPAKQVSLTERYDKNTTTLIEGSTLVRIISLEAVGLPAQLLPSFNFPSSAQFSIYPEKPVETNTFRQQDLIGTTAVKITYLLNKSGQITIPAITLPWFNTSTGKVQKNYLPELNLTITPVAGEKKAPVKTESFVPTQSKQLVIKPQAKQAKSFVNTLFTQSSLAWWLAGGFALAWVMTLLAWFFIKPQQGLAKQKKLVLKQLKAACLANNPMQTRDALLHWGKLQWPNETILNLIDLENLVQDIALKQQIDELAKTLYQEESLNQQWDGERLWQCIKGMRMDKMKPNRKYNDIPPIHKL